MCAERETVWAPLPNTLQVQEEDEEAAAKETDKVQPEVAGQSEECTKRSIWRGGSGWLGRMPLKGQVELRTESQVLDVAA